MFKEAIKCSWIYRFFAAIGRFFGRQWKSSIAITAFLSPMGEGKFYKKGIIATTGSALHRALCWIFEKIRLNKLLKGSIFLKMSVWCLLPCIFAPLLPTAVMIALCAVGFFSFLLTIGCDREFKFTFTPANSFILLYALIYIITTFTSMDVSSSLPIGALTIFLIVYSLVFINSIQSKKQIDIIITIFIIVAVLISLYGCYQYIFKPEGTNTWIDEERFEEISYRVYSTLANPNVLAEYLLLIIPFAGAKLFTAKTWGRRFLALCSLCITCLCMVLTFSRGGWLGLIIAAALFLVIYDRRFILLGIVGLIALYFVLPESIIGRFTSIGDLTDGSTSYRVYIWLGTLAMLKDYWLCGIGPGQNAFNKVYPLYSYNSIIAPHAHNLFLQITADTGFFGLLTFLGILFIFYREMAGRISRETDKDSKMYQIAGISAITGFLVQSMTDYTFYNYRVMFMFWIILAFSLIIGKRSEYKEL